MLGSFCDRAVSPAGLPLSPFLYVFALEPLLRRLRDEEASLPLCNILFANPLSVKVSAYVSDITAFVSRHLYINAVKKAVASYEQIAGAKINFDKSKVSRLGAWRDSVPLPGPFRWGDGPVCILRVWFGPGLQLEWNWSEVQAKVDAQVGTWLQFVEVCAVYIFLSILYHLSVLLLP